MADKMKRLLEKALQKAEKAEIYRVVKKSNPLNFYNFSQVDVLSREHDEISLRLVSNGKLGVFTGSATTEPDVMIAGALKAAEYGPEALFDFPAESAKGHGGKIYDPSLESFSVDGMMADGEEIYDYVRERHPSLPLNLYMDNERSTVSILNSSGKEEEYRMTMYTVCLLSMYERSKEGINSEMNSCRYYKFPRDRIDMLIRENIDSEKQTQVPTKKMPVIFKSSSTWALLYRLLEGVNGMNIALGLSPLKERMNEKIFGENVTLEDDPTLDWARGSTPFDDEGVPTRKKLIVENGVLRNFIFDLSSAAKAGVQPTGNGIRRSMWTRGVEVSPNPRFNNLVFASGDATLDEMISGMEEGLIVNDVIGFHSGNILQGHYSMNVGIGFYVKKGKVVGRAMDAMVSGNIYDDFFRISAIGNELEYNPQAFSPDIMIDGVSVSGRD